MKIFEIVTTTNPQPGYYLIGDSHANGLSVGSVTAADHDFTKPKTWNNLAVTGMHVNDSRITTQLNSIPSGSVVVISLGQNDLTNPKNTAAQLAKIVSTSQQLGHQPIVLVPTQGPTMSMQRDQLRELIKSTITVPLIDLGVAPTKQQGGDGVHLPFGKYLSIAKDIEARYKPKIASVKKL